MYRCLFPDLPRHGQSGHEEPFTIEGAASAVAELIRSQAGAERVHLVGHSLGAQVGAQLMAAEPGLIDRAVLCGTVINTLPAVWLTRNLLGLFAGLSRTIESAQLDQYTARRVGVSSADRQRSRRCAPHACRAALRDRGGVGRFHRSGWSGQVGLTHVAFDRRRGARLRAPVRGHTAPANTQWSRRSRTWNAPRLAPALSGCIRPYGRGLAFGFGPSKPDRGVRTASGRGAQREAGCAVDRIDDGSCSRLRRRGVVFTGSPRSTAPANASS